MFDLFRSRAKAVRYLLGALLIVVAISMVVTLIPGFVGAGYGSENVIAEIGDEALTTREVQANIQQQLRNKAFSREMAGMYVPLIINQMIADRAVAYQAERLGFEVTDADVAQAVRSLIPDLYQNGQFVGQAAYSRYLQQMNLTIPEFESNVRKQMLLLALTNLALEGEVVTDEEIEREYRLKNEKIQVDYISLSPADFRSKVKVTEKEMRDYYEQNKSTFRVGEKRDARILVVEQSKVADSVTVPEEELRRVYRSSPDRFRLPDRVKVRHILLKTMNKSPDEVKQIRAKAEDILKQIKAGADFAELAKKYSEDTGTASQGGDLGWIARGQTVKNFENAAFTLKPGQISDVISTEYGFHIIQVLEKERARVKPFAEVKDELAQERKKQLIYDRMQELADEAHAELLKNPAQADQVASKLGLTVYKVEKVGAGDPIPEVGASADMQDAIYSLPKGGVTQVMQLGADRLGIATVTEIYPARQAEYSEVADSIRERLVAQKAQKMLDEKKKELEKLVKAPGMTLRELARRLGRKIKSSPPFSRGGNVEGLGAAIYMRQAFDEPVGALVGPLTAMGEIIVCSVTKKFPADMTKLAEERAKIANQIKSQKAQERRELLADGILTQLINEGKVKINQRVIDRLVSAYRS